MPVLQLADGGDFRLRCGPAGGHGRGRGDRLSKLSQPGRPAPRPVEKKVSLYFVPVVPYGTDDYLVCPVCSRGLQLSRTQLPHVAPMKRATAAFRAGRLSEANYAAQVDRFWRAMGVHVTGQPVASGPA